MCWQLEILKKIQKKGRVNGYDVELAEAQAKDYMKMTERLTAIEDKVANIDKRLAEQSGKLDLIIQRLNSPVEQEREDGIIWKEIKNGIKSWKFWAVAIFFLTCVALAGDKVLNILNWIPTGV